MSVPRSDRWPSPLGPVTAFELLARAAPARVVAADLLVAGDAALLDGRDRFELLGREFAGVGRGRSDRGAARRGVHARAIGDVGWSRARAGGRVGLPGGGSATAVLALDLQLDVEDPPR